MKKYSKKKKGNQVTSKSLKGHLSPLAHKRVEQCGNFIEMKTDKEKSVMKVNWGLFCENRFCPMCAWRLAQKDALKVSVLMQHLETAYNKAFIFLTLTAPNVKGENLKSEIDRYNKAFKNLVLRNEVAAVNKGYIRKLEITYNKERNDYHPHFHVIMAVNRGYFKDKTYIPQARWLDLWRDVMNCPEITQVDVRKVKNRDGKAVSEVAKYSAKDSDYNYSQSVFDVFYKALRGRQVMTFNGLFAQANKVYKAGELEQYFEPDKIKYYWLILYRWKGEKYIEEQQKRFEGQ